jgi:lysophospholipase L1-like esterase
MTGMTHSRTWAKGLAAALAMAAPLPATAQTSAVFVAERPAPRVDYWQKRAAEIDQRMKARQSLQPVRLAFIGDSITDFWHLDANPWFPGQCMGRSIWDESFGGAVPAQTAINLGVSGDRIEHVLHRLLPAAKGGQGWLDRRDLQPDKIFVLLGINNSFDAESPAAASIYRGVVAVTARIRERKPKAQIVIQSLLPTDSAEKNRDIVVPVNAMLHSYAAANGMAYLDLYPAFTDQQGLQRRELFNDGLHPSRDGYRVWRDRLVEFLGSAGSSTRLHGNTVKQN